MMPDNKPNIADMPQYQCHKKVRALQIEILLQMQDGRASITPAGDFYPFSVSPDYVMRHKPEAGGYYVVYEDGYESYSPAKAFEDGYTKI